MTTPPTDKATECRDEILAKLESLEWQPRSNQAAVLLEIIRRHMGDGSNRERIIQQCADAVLSHHLHGKDRTARGFYEAVFNAERNQGKETA